MALNIVSPVVTTVSDPNFTSIVNPAGAQYVTQTSSVTGAIAITFPVGMLSTMVRITVKVYEYSTNRAFVVEAGGYAYSVGNTWANNPFSYIYGNPGTDRRFTVRFGYTAGGRAVIYIGELASTWAYPQIFVTEVQAGYSGYGAAYTSGWTVGFQASAFENVTATISNPQIGYAVSTNTANSVVLRDGSGDFSANSLTLAGNLTVNGTTTTINSTVTTLDDPIITLGGDTSTVEVTKDRGIEFLYAGATITPTYSATASTTVTGTVASTTGYAAGDIITITGSATTNLDGTWRIVSVPTGTTFTFTTVGAVTVSTAVGTTVKSKVGFFGLDQSTGNFTFIPQANNAAEVFSGTQGTIEAAAFKSTIATGTAPLTIASTTTVTNLSADMLDGSHRDTAYNSFGNGTIPLRHSSGYLFSNYFNMTADTTTASATKIAVETGSDAYLRWQTPAQFITNSKIVDYKNATAQYTLNGGGNVTHTAAGVLWTSRVIAIPVENIEYSSAGYIDINCPTSGTITYYNAAGVTTTATCTASGVPVGAWEALYYQVTEGQASTSDPTKFRLVNYQNPTWSPGPGWLLICAKNGDTNDLKWLPSQNNIPVNGTYYSSTGAQSWTDASVAATALTTATAMAIVFGS